MICAADCILSVDLSRMFVTETFVQKRCFFAKQIKNYKPCGPLNASMATKKKLSNICTSKTEVLIQ